MLRWFTFTGLAMLISAWVLLVHAMEENDDVNARAARFPRESPAHGTPAPNFELCDLQGKAMEFKELVGKRPIVLEFGSYT